MPSIFELALAFISAILDEAANSPVIYLISLAIVLIITREIFSLALNERGKR